MLFRSGLKFLDSTDGGGNALAAVPSSGSITGGGSAQDGLSQVNNGASTIANAIGQAQSALGVGNGNTGPNPITFKKGGSVKKKYTSGGKINLDACGVSTTSKGRKNSSW